MKNKKVLFSGLMMLFVSLVAAHAQKQDEAVHFRTVFLSDQFLHPAGEGPQPYTWAAPQACQLANGDWITVFTDQDFSIQIQRLSPGGKVTPVAKVRQANCYAIAAKGNEFALLRHNYFMKDGSWKGEELYFDLYNEAGKKRKTLQLTGTEERKKDRTEFRRSFPAAISADEHGFEIFYDFYRDNGKYSGDYARWITLSHDFQLTERIENYNRVLGSMTGTLDTLRWAIFLPTRNPRALVLQTYNPEKWTEEWDVEEYDIYEINDGQDKEQFMCRDGVMPFAYGDILEVSGKIYISYVDALKRKDYDGGILEVDPGTGETRRIQLDAPDGSQASIPRIGKLGDRLVILQKELPGKTDRELTLQWRRNGKRYFEPEIQDKVTLRIYDPATKELSPGKPVMLDWINQPLNEASTCIYQTYRDRDNDLVGVRMFSGETGNLIFHANDSQLQITLLEAKLDGGTAGR